MLVIIAFGLATLGEAAEGDLAREILDATGVKGGLVVHLNCGDGKLAAALHADGRCIVYGLDTRRENVDLARKYIRSRGIYGKVSADLLDGRAIPLIDDTVNLLVAGDMGDVPMSEVLRVLCPNGTAYVRKSGRWEKTVKRRPEELDDWTHYHHDPAGTMVGLDEVVGPPGRFQWIGDPKWLRNHEFMSSMHAMVSSNGRIFYIMDEGLRNHIFLPADWKLIARDAFNGTILWKRDIKSWQTHIWPMKSGPGYMPRRLVAVGDTVYVTLGYNEPVAAIDAVTGQTIRTYDGTKAAEELIVSDGILYLLNDADKQPLNFREATTVWGKAKNRANTTWGWSKDRPKRTVMAVDAASGRVLWKNKTNIAPLTLTVGPEQVFFFNGDGVVALDRGTGDEKWITTLKIKAQLATGYAHRMVLSEGVLVFCHNMNVDAMDAATGRVLWQGKLLPSGHNSPNDIFVIKGLVWSAQTGKAQANGTAFKALGLHTGQEEQNFVARNPEVYFMHQRCYPGRATERYIMTSGTGTEFYEIGGPEVCEIHHYVRGSCIYGLMPANGLLYKPPDSCACHYQSKVTYLCALAPGKSQIKGELSEARRLEKGRAYGAVREKSAESDDDWPQFRHDSARSGGTAAHVPTKLRQKWRTNIGGKLSAMTVADGRAFVAEIDSHTLHALDAGSGKTAWVYTAGGRIDSAPTIYRGTVLFGSADGWVYCLRASDGELAWRYRAAPGADKLPSRQQIESLWPVHGSVLIWRDVAYCLAGRNMFFDGGMRLVLLDPATGEKISETILNEIDPETGLNLQTKMPGKAMPVANPDILSCDGNYIYMGAQKFDFEGRRIDIDAPRDKEKTQTGEGRHLFCPTGFLDDNWFHRSYMMYGLTGGEGHGEYTSPPNITPAGRVLVLDRERVYGFRAAVYNNTMQPRPYHFLFAADRDDRTVEETPQRNRQTKVSYLWTSDRPALLVNAIVVAGGTIFIAGPPEIADEEKGFGINMEEDNEVTRSLAEQARAWRGAKGAILQAVDKQTGKKIAEYRLDYLPVFDGMAAAEGSLFIPLKDGTVVCMGE
jgi:outer membrane protein assembly factor BamB